MARFSRRRWRKMPSPARGTLGRSGGVGSLALQGNGYAAMVLAGDVPVRRFRGGRATVGAIDRNRQGFPVAARPGPGRRCRRRRGDIAGPADTGPHRNPAYPCVARLAPRRIGRPHRWPGAETHRTEGAQGAGPASGQPRCSAGHRRSRPAAECGWRFRFASRIRQQSARYRVCADRVVHGARSRSHPCRQCADLSAYDPAVALRLAGGRSSEHPCHLRRVAGGTGLVQPFPGRRYRGCGARLDAGAARGRRYLRQCRRQRQRIARAHHPDVRQHDPRPAGERAETGPAR